MLVRGRVTVEMTYVSVSYGYIMGQSPSTGGTRASCLCQSLSESLSVARTQLLRVDRLISWQAPVYTSTCIPVVLV